MCGGGGDADWVANGPTPEHNCLRLSTGSPPGEDSDACADTIWRPHELRLGGADRLSGSAIGMGSLAVAPFYFVPTTAGGASQTPTTAAQAHPSAGHREPSHGAESARRAGAASDALAQAANQPLLDGMSLPGVDRLSLFGRCLLADLFSAAVEPNQPPRFLALPIAAEIANEGTW